MSQPKKATAEFTLSFGDKGDIYVVEAFTVGSFKVSFVESYLVIRKFLPSNRLILKP